MDGASGSAADVSTLTDVDAFARIPVGDWDALVEALPHPSPYVLHGWLAARLRHRSEGSRPRIHVSHRGGRVVAALPLEVSRHFGLLVGDLASGPHAVWPDLLLAPGEPESTGRALVGCAANSDHDFLRVHGLAPDSRLARLAGLELVHRVDAPVLDLSDGWEAVYHAKASKRHRQDHRHKRGALATLGPLETRVARTTSELEAVLDETFRLHELRWSGRDDRYGYARADERRFMRDAVARLGARDQYRIVTLELDGSAVAFLSFFVLAGAAVGHRTAFDPRYGRYSPGALVFLDGFAQASSEQLDRFEFGSGDEPFKRALADRCEPLCDGFGLATDLRGSVGMAAALEGTRLRRRVKEWDAARRSYGRARSASRSARASLGARAARSPGRSDRAARAPHRRSGPRPG